MEPQGFTALASQVENCPRVDRVFRSGRASDSELRSARSPSKVKWAGLASAVREGATFGFASGVHPHAACISIEAIVCSRARLQETRGAIDIPLASDDAFVAVAVFVRPACGTVISSGVCSLSLGRELFRRKTGVAP
jgi:hypothetical protein